MNASQKRIIRNYCRGASGLGLVLGPGLDASPLAATWAAGVLHLAHDADFDLEEADVKASVAGIVVAFGTWIVSGKIAQAVTWALLAIGLAGAGLTVGVSAFISIAATLSLNATINAVFTYRFLTACANLINDSEFSGTIFFKASVDNLLHSLLTVSELPDDIAKCAKLMATETFHDDPGTVTRRVQVRQEAVRVDLLTPRYADALPEMPDIDLLTPRYPTRPVLPSIDPLTLRYPRHAGPSRVWLGSDALPQPDTTWVPVDLIAGKYDAAFVGGRIMPVTHDPSL